MLLENGLDYAEHRHFDAPDDELKEERPKHARLHPDDISLAAADQAFVTTQPRDVSISNHLNLIITLVPILMNPVDNAFFITLPSGVIVLIMLHQHKTPKFITHSVVTLLTHASPHSLSPLPQFVTLITLIMTVGAPPTSRCP